MIRLGKYKERYAPQLITTGGIATSILGKVAVLDANQQILSKRHQMVGHKKVVSLLNDLVEDAGDGENGFRNCADQVEASDIKRLFAERAPGCAQASQELESLVMQYGGEPASGGTVSGAFHRG